MPRLYKHGQIINGYTIKRDDFYNTGAMAKSYAAVAPDGKKVFFKQYASPSVRVPWYRDYVDYQKELKRRIEANAELNEFCYDMLDFFEEKRCYHQVFGWCEAPDISKILEMVKAGRGPDFNQRCILARRLMGSMTTLHKAKIIHADLKPENLQAIKDDSIKAGYKLVLIDMDYSVLSDRKAPWHDDPDTGYVGSPNYYSPEHLRGKAPIPASDVFSCSLILHDLLGAGHPYESEEDDEYREKALNFSASKPRLEGEIKDAATTELVADYLQACLNPDPTKRPTAEELRDALNGKAKPSPPPPPPPPPPPNVLTLEGPNGDKISLRIKTQVGKSVVRQFGEDARYWSEPQFTLDKIEADWRVTHDSNAGNETLLNGKAVSGIEPLKDGDVLAVGKEAKGIVKLPLKVIIN